jgi:hypothetical protein
VLLLALLRDGVSGIYQRYFVMVPVLAIQCCGSSISDAMCDTMRADIVAVVVLIVASVAVCLESTSGD